MKMGKRALCAAWGLSVCANIIGCAHPGGAQHGGEHGHHKAGVIIVTGVGEARAEPNLARASIGVEVRAPSVQEALQQANAQMTQLTNTLKQQGIADADLSTKGFSVSFDRDYMPPQPVMAAPEAAPRAQARGGKAPNVEATAPVESAPPPSRGSYVVNNQLEVTVRDVSKLGTVLSAATASGANNIWGINFDIEDKRPLIEKARAMAFEHAKADAERIAALSGVKLHKLSRVVDGATGGVSFGGVRQERLSASSAVPVEVGQLTVNHQVELEYEISTK